VILYFLFFEEYEGESTEEEVKKIKKLHTTPNLTSFVLLCMSLSFLTTVKYITS